MNKQKLQEQVILVKQLLGEGEIEKVISLLSQLTNNPEKISELESIYRNLISNKEIKEISPEKYEDDLKALSFSLNQEILKIQKKNEQPNFGALEILFIILIATLIYFWPSSDRNNLSLDRDSHDSLSSTLDSNHNYFKDSLSKSNPTGNNIQKDSFISKTDLGSKSESNDFQLKKTGIDTTKNGIAESNTLSPKPLEMEKFEKEIDKLKASLSRTRLEYKQLKSIITESYNPQELNKDLDKIRDRYRMLIHHISQANSLEDISNLKSQIREINISIKKLSEDIFDQQKLAESDYLDRFDEAIQAKKDLIKGQIAYRIQDSMYVNTITRIAMTIGDNKVSPDSMEIIVQHLTTIGERIISLKKDIKIEGIKIGEKMKARLIDPQAPYKPAFNIKPLSQETQKVNIEGGTLTSWQWDVYPLRAGEFLLNLVVDAILKSDGEETPISIPAFDKEVTVSAQENQNLASAGVMSKGSEKSPNLLQNILIVTLICLVSILLFRQRRYFIRILNQTDDGELIAQMSLKRVIMSFFSKNIDEEYLKALLSQDRLEKVLIILNKHTIKELPEFQKDIIALQARLARLKKDKYRGTKTIEEVNVERARLNEGLQDLVEDLKNENVNNIWDRKLRDLRMQNPLNNHNF